MIAWYAADAADGEYTKISGASGDTWTIPAGYQGKYISQRDPGRRLRYAG
ncbi:MAG: hypothetical protein ACLS8R_06715 [Anaeromassilibacillus sp.]